MLSKVLKNFAYFLVGVDFNIEGSPFYKECYLHTDHMAGGDIESRILVFFSLCLVKNSDSSNPVLMPVSSGILEPDYYLSTVV